MVVGIIIAVQWKGGRGEIWEGRLRRSRGMWVRKKKGLKPGRVSSDQ
jgi:hypothetical protein